MLYSYVVIFKTTWSILPGLYLPAYNNAAINYAAKYLSRFSI